MGRILVNGSFNWTTGAVQNNRENIVISCSTSLVATFQRQFDRCWRFFAPDGCQDAADKLAVTGSFDSDKCAALFFPDKDDENLRILLDEVSSAKETLDVCVFTLTMRDTINAMIQLHKQGVRVRVISDDFCSKFLRGKAKKKLEKAGIPYRTDASRYHMHHKFAVVDGRTVINGSF